MKSILNLTTALSFLFISAFLFSCSKDLSRGKAEDLIVKAYDLPHSESVELLKEYYVSQHSSGWSTSLISGEHYSNNKEKLDELQSKGLITVGDTTEYGNDIDYTYALIKLTDEGNKYLIQDAGGKYILKSCDVVFGEVTGIQIREQDKVALANYTIIRKNITPFGNNVSQGPESLRASFSLYDDGWRINKR